MLRYLWDLGNYFRMSVKKVFLVWTFLLKGSWTWWLFFFCCCDCWERLFKRSILPWIKWVERIGWFKRIFGSQGPALLKAKGCRDGAGWGAGMAQRWEHSPRTNVARVRFPDPASCGLCSFSTLHWDVFSRHSSKPGFDLICVNCLFQFTVSPISALALERLDT